MSSQSDLAHTPAAAPPAGQLSNFVDPPSQEVTIIAVSVVTITLTIIFLFIRLYTSLRINRMTGLEDWLCVAAVVLSFSYNGIVLSLAYVSRHMWDVPLIWLTENYWKYRFAQNILQALAYFTSRMPILLLYLRLFGRQRGIRIAVYIAMLAAFGIYLTSIPLLSYFCAPAVNGDWGSLDVFAKCKRLLDWAIVQGSCDIALNVYILVIPLAVVSRLQMALKKKLGVLAIFLVGLLGVICSALGLYYRYQLGHTTDTNWNEGAFICMSIVEINIAIICSCMPALASFFKHTFANSSFLVSLRSIFRTSSSSRGTNGKENMIDAYSSMSGFTHSQQKDPGYVELQERPGWVGGQQQNYSANTIPRTSNTGSHRPAGITKTVAVDVL